MCSPQGTTGAHGGLSVLKSLVCAGGLFSPQQKRSPARFYFLPTPPSLTATPHANPCWGVEEGAPFKAGIVHDNHNQR